ncbi:MAG TPA: DNRLRE domain-containing protein [Kofleriaceae bacterium]|nr:DNRLRE domain-containing protein [Kofleriaceae bacterium]
MARGRIAVIVCLLAGCADIQPNEPDEPDESSSDAAPDIDEDLDAGQTAAPDADPLDPDAGPGDELTRIFGAADFQDTYVRLNNPTFNYGGVNRMCADTTTDDRRMLIRVDVSSLAAGVEVTGAELHIWTGTAANDLSTQIYSAYPMLESWTEGNLSAAAGTASWNQRSSNTAWTTAGAGTGSRAASAVGSFIPAAIDTEYTIDLEVDMVQGWVDDAATNHGITIVSAGEDGGCFDTSEFATASKRPSLVVTYR